MSDLLNNPWVITIGAGLIVGLILRYVFGIGRPTKYSIEELKEMFDKLKDNQTNIGDNPSIIENNIIIIKRQRQLF
jgi:hypothetical protein